jgi:hypothetical protein
MNNILSNDEQKLLPKDEIATLSKLAQKHHKKLVSRWADKNIISLKIKYLPLIFSLIFGKLLILSQLKPKYYVLNKNFLTDFLLG